MFARAERWLLAMLLGLQIGGVIIACLNAMWPIRVIGVVVAVLCTLVIMHALSEAVVAEAIAEVMDEVNRRYPGTESA